MQEENLRKEVQEVEESAAKQKDVKKKRDYIRVPGILLAICLIFVGGFIIGQKSNEAEVKKARQEANEKVELLSQKIIQDTTTTYQEKLKLELEFIDDLKEYRKWVIENNTNPNLNTNYIDDVLIRNYILKAQKEKGYENIVPDFDTSAIYDNADEYLEKYVKELQNIVDKYQYSYRVNEKVKKCLEKIERYNPKINSPEILKSVFELEQKCEDNIQFWDEIGQLD